MTARPGPLVFTGGPILTMAGGSRVEALAVEGERIVHAGTLAECRDAAGEARREINLGGRTLMPGFVDAHCHPLMLGQTASWVDVGPGRATSIAALVRLLAERAERLPPDVPLRAYGYDYRRFTERRHPSAADLDRVAIDREVYVMNVSGHGGVVNSHALATHGITAATPDPVGGTIGRHPDGTPDGLLWDAACDLLTGPEGVKVGNHGPNIHLPETADETARQADHAQDAFLRAGITTVLDAQVSRRETEAYLAARAEGRLRLRVGMLVISALLDELLAIGLHGRLGDDLLAFDGLKLYADGALGAGTAFFPDGYAGEPENHGVLYHEPDEYRELVRRAHAAGLQTGTHAQSPAAIEMVVETLEAVQRERPRSDRRHAIEHCGLPTDDQIRRIAAAGIVPVSQPQHHRLLGDGLLRTLGPELAGRYNPLGLYARAGIPVVISSDAPVAAPAPLAAVQAAVERRTEAGAVLGGPELRIDVETALRGYTSAAAFVLHRERAVGSLEAGKLADLAILDADPTGTDPGALGAIRVEETWLGGERVAWT